MSRYCGVCSFPKCFGNFHAGKTRIIGAHLRKNGQFEGKPTGSPFWICAKHSSLTNGDTISTEESTELQRKDEESSAKFKNMVQELKRQKRMEQLNWEKYKSNEITHGYFWRGAVPGLPQGQQCNQCQPLSWTVFEDQYRGRTQKDLTSSHSFFQQVKEYFSNRMKRKLGS